MDLRRDIHSLTDFKKNTPEFLQQLKETGEPVVLTINGKAELVVQDAESYQKLLDLAEAARVVDGIRRGLEEIKAETDHFPAPGTGEWGVMNQRRSELIHKKNREGLSVEERWEFERLQRLCFAKLQEATPRPFVDEDAVRRLRESL